MVSSPSKTAASVAPRVDYFLAGDAAGAGGAPTRKAVCRSLSVSSFISTPLSTEITVFKAVHSNAVCDGPSEN